MALLIPSFPDPTDKSAPVANAYAVRSYLATDVAKSSGRLTYLVYRSQAAYAAGSAPLGTVDLAFGQDFGNGQAMPSASVFLNDPSLQAAFAAVFGWLDSRALNHPSLVGSTEVV